MATKLPSKGQIAVDGRTVTLSNLDKVLYPQAGFTKGEVIAYYQKIAPFILPHVKDRPLTLKRYPNGVEGEFFYEKECPRFHPDWVQTITASSKRASGEIHYCSLQNRASLLWVANLASLELHVLLSRGDHLDRPTAMAFDLDPGPGRTILDCGEVGFQLRERFNAMGLETFLKTSGKKGLHLYVPLNTAVTFDQTKEFAHEIALQMEEAYPKDVVSSMRKDLRVGKILIDWSQNDDHKTTVAVYSLRASDEPSVSTPITWDELAVAIKKRKRELLQFSPQDVLARVAKKGDLFREVETLKQKLPKQLAASVGVIAPPLKKSRKGSKAAHVALSTYRQKRDFKVTAEPQAGGPSAEGKKIFVIQKHDASHLHYDFRLESGGVLKSWAVPKGPSTDPAVSRLAMMTEDHPMDYAGFEGVIPKGEYGGGPVMVWDTGTYVNLTHHDGKIVPLAQGLAKGHIDFWLKGKKLQGGWSLVRKGHDPKTWFLRKMKDAAAHKPEDPVASLPKSVLTQRTIEQIESDKKSNVWHSNR